MRSYLNATPFKNQQTMQNLIVCEDQKKMKLSKKNVAIGSDSYA